MNDALVHALLLGNLEGLSPETVSLFARTGLIHLFSASGFHMAVAVMIAKLCTHWPEKWLRHGRGVRVVGFLLQLAFMTYFGVATGWSSPLVRAFTFTVLLSAARLLELKPSTPWVFLLSLLCSSLFGRGSLLSFFLSAAGMAGILFIQPRKWWAVALGPWIATSPIIIWVFGSFSLAAPLWNLTVGAFVAAAVMPPAILHLLVSSLGLPDPLLPVAAWLMELAVSVLAWGDGWLGGAFWVPRWPFVVAVLALAACWHLRGRWRWAAFALTAIVAVAFPLPRLAMLDVGQGDSIFFRTAAGRILMDVGPPGFKGREARAAVALGQVGVGAIDHLILSHLDLDHRGGLDSVLRTHPVRGAVWIREEALSQKAAMKFLEEAERYGAEIRFLTLINAPEGMECYFAPAVTANDVSPLCIATLPRGDKIWLTGDMDSRAESWLLAHHPGLPKAKYLKVAHHGSRSSSSADFLLASGAREALVSVGRKNRYGHPTKEALDRLSGMSIRRTDQEGNLVFY